MSSGSQEKGAEVSEELARELRQFTGLGAALFRAAAARTGMTVTDIEVIDNLDSAGPMTAGQLADLTGLTTGAITGMLNRLEEAGLVRRERDPMDGRRVIVHLERDRAEMREINSIYDALAREWAEMASHYNDEQIAFLLEFLKRSNEVSREEIVHLRDAPSGEEGTLSAPLGDLENARLVVSSGVSRLILRVDNAMTELYQAEFEGPAPDVKVKDGVVTLRYPRRLWMLEKQRIAEITLNTAIPWQITIQGAASEVNAKLGGLKLAGLEIKGGLNMIHLDLPTPEGVVPIRISGGASTITVRRPAGVATRANLKGWVSQFVFDKQSFSDVGNNVRVQSPGYEVAAGRYDIEVSSSASTVTISTKSIVPQDDLQVEPG